MVYLTELAAFVAAADAVSFGWLDCYLLPIVVFVNVVDVVVLESLICDHSADFAEISR